MSILEHCELFKPLSYSCCFSPWCLLIHVAFLAIFYRTFEPSKSGMLIYSSDQVAYGHLCAIWINYCRIGMPFKVCHLRVSMYQGCWMHTQDWPVNAWPLSTMSTCWAKAIGLQFLMLTARSWGRTPQCLFKQPEINNGQIRANHSLVISSVVGIHKCEIIRLFIGRKTKVNRHPRSG